MDNSVEFVYFSYYSPDHRDVINKLNRDEASRRFLGNNLFETIEMIQRRSDEDFRNRTYIVRVDDKSVGIINLTNRSIIDEQFEIDIGIIPEYRRKGIGELVSSTFIDFIFEKIKSIDTLYFKINFENKASISLSEKLGLTLHSASSDTLIYVKNRELVNKKGKET